MVQEQSGAQMSFEISDTPTGKVLKIPGKGTTWLAPPRPDVTSDGMEELRRWREENPAGGRAGRD